MTIPNQTGRYIQTKYRPEIDGLRALAVISVVAYHTFPELLSGGFIGVDIFFVISGYLISTIIFENLNQSTFRFLQFYSRRIIRIFPTLTLVLFSVLVLGFFTLTAIEFEQLGKHVAAGAGFSSNFVLLNEAGYFDKSALTKPLLHLWSLGIEEQFYLVLPLLIASARKYKFSVIKILFTISIASFILTLEKVGLTAASNFYSPLSRFWELLAGSILAWFTLKNTSNNVSVESKLRTRLSRVLNFAKPKSSLYCIRNTVSGVGSILLLIGLTQIDDKMAFPSKLTLIPVAGTVLILYAGSNTWVNSKFFSNRFAVWFGLISYPLYLWHWPLLTFTRIILGDTPSINTRIGVIILSVLLAWISWRFVEKPLRLKTYRKAIASVLTMLIGIIGFSGYFIYRSQGLPKRSLNVINEIVVATQNYNWQADYRLDICYIRDEESKPNKYSSDCGLKQNETTPTLLLWGDSYSASLYRGFVKQGKEIGFLVSQFSASGCPPILEFNVSKRSNCINLNNYVLDQIRDLKPDALVMAANWQLYDGNSISGWEKFDSELFIATINIIKDAGVSNVFIVGQLPVYSVKQTDMLTNRNFRSKLDVATYRNFLDSAIPANEKMRSLSSSLDVAFISPLDLLCNLKGCRITVPGESVNPMSYDEGHLTAAGSEHLVAEFFNRHLIHLR